MGMKRWLFAGFCLIFLVLSVVGIFFIDNTLPKLDCDAEAEGFDRGFIHSIANQDRETVYAAIPPDIQERVRQGGLYSAFNALKGVRIEAFEFYGFEQGVQANQV